jgi:hypothetical protein
VTTPSDSRRDAFGYALLPGCSGDVRACSFYRRFEMTSSLAWSSSRQRIVDAAPEEARFGTFELGARLRLGPVAGHLAPGDHAGWLRDTPLSDLRFRAARGDDRGAFEVEAETLLVGGRVQHIDASERGFALVAGTSVAYLHRRETYGEWNEALGLLALPGAYLDLHLLGAGARLSLSARVNGDFAGVNAPSWEAWESANPDSRGKTILIKQGYWYGWGWSTRLEAELALPGVSFGGRFRFGRYASAEGLDRAQESVTDDVPGRERVLDGDAFVRVGPFGPGPDDATGARTGIFVELAYEHRERSGQLGSERRGDRAAHEGALRRVALRFGVRR